MKCLITLAPQGFFVCPEKESPFKQGEVIEATPLPCFEICQLVYDMNNDNINAEVRLETVDPKSVGSAVVTTTVEIVPYLKELFCK